jgi:signal transduction histidine kinase/DNA-binding response OmpR family regulator/HPt (histidine-containing phosphotransfer) domain-containing protein
MKATPVRSRAHPIVRLNFQTRLVACPLVAIILLSSRLTSGEAVSAPLWLAAALYALVWPHVAYAISRRTGDAARELRVLMVDSALTGAAIALAGFRPIPTLCLAIPVTTFSASIGGLPFMVRGVSALVASALLTGLLFTGFSVGATAPSAQILAALGLATFQTMLGLFTFRTARGFAESRRQLASQAEEIRRQNAELVEARESALEAVKAKSAFLATMSHEIRTPLNGVLGMARLLAETPLTAEQQDLLRTVRASGDTLVTVINDILDYSRVESGRLELEEVPVDVVSVVEDALEIVSDTARRKGIELVCEIAGDVPATILGDATRLRQVVTNLAGNAVKFTEHGEVVVGVRQLKAGSAGEPAEIEVSVRDTGIGIPADRIPLLFTAFSQADTSTTRRYGGTGLGLAISKRLVGLMGGDIRVESEPGRGSTFSFTLRGRVAPSQPRLVAPVAAGARVLVVDDHATNRRALCGQLRLWGFDATEAASGDDALAALDGGFDLAILDYHMPQMDGMELARRIRADARTASMPMVLLSSSLVLAKDDPAAFFAARLLKPARQSSLFDAIAGALGSSAASRGSEPAPNEEHAFAAGLRVLIADDNDVNRDIARLVLRRFGAQADEATNGREAIDLIEKKAGGERAYALVLMDVQMPVMDGLEATRAIRRLQQASPSRAWPRIVAMTANAMQEDRATCLAAGMDDYLTKPLNFEEVGRVLREVASAEPPGAKPQAGAALEPLRSMANGSMDWSRLEELAEYDTPDRTVVRGAIASLADEGPTCLDEIRRSIGGRDVAQLRASAHKLKGAASNLGAVALAGCASQIESAAKNGELDAVDSMVDELAVALEASLRDLRSYAGTPAEDGE